MYLSVLLNLIVDINSEKIIAYDFKQKLYLISIFLVQLLLVLVLLSKSTILQHYIQNKTNIDFIDF